MYKLLGKTEAFSEKFLTIELEIWIKVYEG